MICSEWRKVELSEVARFSNKRINSKELTSENYISTENLLPNKEGKTKATSIPNGNVIKYMPGQTLLSNIRPYFKKIWYASNSGGSSTDVLVFETTEEIDDRYFFYYLNQDRFFQHVMAGAKGTKMPRGDKQQILKFQFEYPQKNEQKEIAATLSCLDDKIELNNRINKNLEEMAQSIFKRWFVDFEFPDENGNPYKSSGGEMVESELGEIPKGWRPLQLRDALSISTSSIDPQKVKKTIFEHYSIPAYDADGIPVFEEANEIKSNKYLVDKNCFLVSKLNPATQRYWRPLHFTNNAICSTEFIVYFCKNKYHLNFYYSLINENKFYNYLISHSSGSTNSRQRVTPSITLDFKFVCPTDNVIKYFVEIVDILFLLIQENIKEKMVLKTIKDSLLPKLMSGEIRVPCEEAV